MSAPDGDWGTPDLTVGAEEINGSRGWCQVTQDYVHIHPTPFVTTTPTAAPVPASNNAAPAPPRNPTASIPDRVVRVLVHEGEELQ